jgi:glyoxylase-like metal-dependent hydrolase (beta-lactamase superfamily II)
MANNTLLQLTEHTWILPGPTNIGMVVRDGGVYMIDSGNDKDAGRRIRKVLDEKGWRLKAIICTHSNADHIGANDYLQRLTGCEIWATPAERAFIEYPKFEPAFLWGSFPVKELNSKFYEARPSKVTNLIEADTATIAGDLEVISLPGHFFGMIGILTPDRVLFLGDCMFGEKVLEKYKIPFIYDVAGYRETIGKVQKIEADHYIVSHGDPQTDIGAMAEVNLALVDEVEAFLLETLERELTDEEAVKAVCDHYQITLDYGQYALVGTTVRSFLAYLYNASKLSYEFRENRLYWKRA